MSSSVKYSPVPAVLTRPELLAELNLLMTRIASGCRVGIPASCRPVIQFPTHRTCFSGRFPPGDSDDRQ